MRARIQETPFATVPSGTLPSRNIGNPTYVHAESDRDGKYSGMRARAKGRLGLVRSYLTGTALPRASPVDAGHAAATSSRAPLRDRAGKYLSAGKLEKRGG